MRAIPMRRVALVSLLTLALMVSSCSKSSGPTAPPTTSNSFDSGSLVAPTTFDHVFTVAGTVGYHCNFHRSVGMIGQVVVDSTGAPAVNDTASGTSFHPLVVTVRPGGTVHWVILNGTHTVTSDDVMSGGGGY